MGVNVSVRGRMELQQKVAHLGPAVRKAGARRLAEIGEHLATYAKEHFSDNGLHARSGDLRRSEQAMPVKQFTDRIQGGMMASQSLPYGPIQEYGGVIRAKNSTYLTIPMEEVMTASGVARFSAGEAEGEGYHTFVRNHILFGIKDGVLYPLFVLVPSVTIPPRPFVGPVLEANRAYIEQQLHAAVSEGIKEAH